MEGDFPLQRREGVRVVDRAASVGGQRTTMDAAELPEQAGFTVVVAVAVTFTVYENAKAFLQIP